MNFCGMYAAHDSFRRDLDHLVDKAARGTAVFAQHDAGWQNFKHQLLLHHRAEDQSLWPRLQEQLNNSRLGQTRLVIEMQAEHAQIDPLLAGVDAAVHRNGRELKEAVETLADAIRAHLEHEERRALPLIDSVLTEKDWRRFIAAIRKAQGMRGAARFVPWILDGTPTAQQQRFFDELPAPLRLIARRLWQPRYQRLHLWA